MRQLHFSVFTRYVISILNSQNCVMTSALLRLNIYIYIFFLLIYTTYKKINWIEWVYFWCSTDLPRLLSCIKWLKSLQQRKQDQKALNKAEWITAQDPPIHHRACLTSVFGAEDCIYYQYLTLNVHNHFFPLEYSLPLYMNIHNQDLHFNHNHDLNMHNH